MTTWFWLIPAASVVTLGSAYFFFRQMMSEDEGTETMRAIAAHVRAGALAYLQRQYRVVGLVFAGLAGLFCVLAYGLHIQNPWVPFAFLTGGFFSGLAGFIDMKTATYASARTANAARDSLNHALRVAFRSGAVMGLSVVGGLPALTDLYMMNRFQVTLINPRVVLGLFLGAMMTMGFSGLTMKAVGRAAGQMVDEVRRQFAEHPGIMSGAEDPDYKRCVSMSTKAAQREMLLPALLAIAAPLVVGLLFGVPGVPGVPGVLGLLAGSGAGGFSVSMFMANTGGAWDNAKKYIEEGHVGGKGSEAHRAAVIGDTVGDPFKDTAGPSLNILVKLMSMEAIVIAGVTVAFSLS